MIKPAYSVSFLLSINIFVWQNVLYFLDAPRNNAAVSCRFYNGVPRSAGRTIHYYVLCMPTSVGHVITW